MPSYMPQELYAEMVITIVGIHLKRGIALSIAANTLVREHGHAYEEESLNESTLQAALWLLKRVKRQSRLAMEVVAHQVDLCCREAYARETMAFETLKVQHALFQTACDKPFSTEGALYLVGTHKTLLTNFHTDGRRKQKILGLFHSPFYPKETTRRTDRLADFKRDIQSYYRLGIELGRFIEV